MRSTPRSFRKTSVGLSSHVLDLPREEKLAYGGALVTGISAFFPWFAFGAENVYNGFQNVTWLIGYSVFCLSLLILLPWGLAIGNTAIPRFFTRQSLHWAVTGGLIVLLTSIALSVYAAFEWIAIRSSIHYGVYAALCGGAMLLLAGGLNRTKGLRSHVHVAHVEPPTTVADEEIERYLQRRETPPRAENQRPGVHSSDTAPKATGESPKHDGRTSMFDE